MFCEKCGSPIGPNEKFCTNCGQAVMPSQMSNNAQTNYSSMNQMNNIGNSMENGINSNYSNPMNSMNPQNVYTPSNNSMNSFQTNNMPMNYYTPTNNKNGSSKGGIIAIIIVFVIALVVAFCIIALPKIMNKDNNSDSSSNVESGNKISYKDFTFNIPNGLQNEYDNGSLILYNNQWAAYVDIETMDFSQIKSNLLAIKANFQQEGYIVEKTDISTYNNVEFVIFYLTDDSGTVVATFAKLNTNYVIGFVVFNESSTYGDDILNSLATFVKSAKYSPSSMGMKASTSRINVKDAFELVK